MSWSLRRCFEPDQDDVVDMSANIKNTDDKRKKNVDGDLVSLKVVALTPHVDVNKTCKPPDLPHR